jgi:hypothetical protein
VKFYHATPIENAFKIVEEGVIKKGHDNAVYLCTSADDAVKFPAIRGHYHIIVFEVDVDEKLVEESFDHAEGFFKCKAYMYHDDIPDDKWGPQWEYDLRDVMKENNKKETKKKDDPEH